MTTTRRRAVGSAPLAAKLLLSAVLLGSRVAHAQAEAQPDPPPWHQGVSEERKQKAQALFEEGRELNRGLMLAEARAKYEEALTYWEHPQIRFYLGRVLKRIGLPLLAYENLQKALRWGPGALDPEDDQSARADLRELMQRELAAIEIRCAEPGAEVMLDGKRWFIGQRTERRMVLPGEHVITAKKAGYYLVVRPVVVLAGKEASGVIKLSVDTTVTTRLWPVWQPWAVAGGGAAFVALGAGLQSLAIQHRDETDQQFQGTCGPSCPPASADAYDRSLWENRFAIGSFIVGGTALLTGSVLIVMNRSRTVRTEDRGAIKVDVSPMVSASGASLSTRLSF